MRSTFALIEEEENISRANRYIRDCLFDIYDSQWTNEHCVPMIPSPEREEDLDPWGSGDDADTSGQMGAGDRSGSPAGADASGIGVPSLDETEQWGTGSFEEGGTWGSSRQNFEEQRVETIAEADNVSAEDTVAQVM